MPSHPDTREPVYPDVGTAYGWLADDGQHVWVRHDCGPESVTVYLPHPQWRRRQAGTLTPPLDEFRGDVLALLRDTTPHEED